MCVNVTLMLRDGHTPSSAAPPTGTILANGRVRALRLFHYSSTQESEQSLVAVPLFTAVVSLHACGDLR